MKNENEIPRRIRLDRMIKAEKSIYESIQEVEKIGADVRLTNAITLLGKAQNLVSDYVDEQPDLSKVFHIGQTPISEQYFKDNGFKYVEMIFENEPMIYWRKDKIIVKRWQNGWLVDLYNDKEEDMELDVSTVERLEFFMNNLL